MKKLLVIAGLILASGLAANAQFQGQVFQQNASVKVYAYGSEKTLAWAGGANNPQPALADLNNDGKQDLVFYEPYVGVKTFINTGTAGNPKYTYTPIYQATFPSIYGYMKLIDYNNDGIPDLFQRGGSGFSVFKGHYNSNNRLDFTYFKDLYYFLQGSGWINAYCEPSDIPAIEDIDGDGDLDFLSYYIGGGRINLYRNCREEDGLSDDSIRICLKDNCWGKTFQGWYRAHELHSSCGAWGTSCKGCPEEGTGNKTTHTGNALCVLDYDGDGDFDYMDGSVSYNDVQLVLNGKADYNFQIDSMLWQDSTWNSNGHMLKMATWPGIFWLDIDQDNDRDLMITPTATGTENYKNIAYYENTGSNSSPVFTYRSDSFIVDKMIDVGTASYPFFYDYDKDGKTDLFIGSDGYYQADGSLKSKVSYYHNTSVGSNIRFDLETIDFLQLSTHSFKGAAIAIGDLDNDGKDDLVLGHANGTISFFKNTASSGTAQPVWGLTQLVMKDKNGADIVATTNAAPVIYDIDKDGRKDLIIGNNTGFLYYYKNDGVTGTLSVGYVTNKLGNAKADPNSPAIYTMSAPYIGRMDNTGTEYLVMGSKNGSLYRFDGFQNGNVTTPYAMIDTMYSLINAGMRTAPAFADLDGDNKYEMVVGNQLGGVTFYKQLFDVGVPQFGLNQLDVKLFPNPATDALNITWHAVAGDHQINIKLISVLGQKLVETTVPASEGNKVLDLSHLAPGTYHCVVQADGERIAKPIVIAR